MRGHQQAGWREMTRNERTKHSVVANAVHTNVVHSMLYQMLYTQCCTNVEKYTVMHVYVGVYVFRTLYHRVVPSFFRLLELSQLSEAIKSVLNNLALAELIPTV